MGGLSSRYYLNSAAPRTILSGATNGRTGCIGHISLLASPKVYAGVRDFVR